MRRWRAALPVALVLAGCAGRPAASTLPGPFGPPGPAAPLPAQPCPAPPPPVVSLNSEPFYTDARGSVPDPARLAADIEAGRPLGEFLAAVQRPTEAWVALRDPQAAACAIGLLDAWARGGALLGDFNRQGGYRRNWTLAGLALAYLALREAPGEAAARARIEAWLVAAARPVMPVFDHPVPPHSTAINDRRNNLVVWAGLAVAAAGVAGGEPALLAWGVGKAGVFLDGVRPDGAHPQELARGRLALHYHLFALGPLAAVARLGEAAGAPLDPRRSEALARFAAFTLAATQDEAQIAALAGAPQAHLARPRPWLAHGHGFEILRPSPAEAARLAPFRPFRERWLGGNVTLLWGGR